MNSIPINVSAEFYGSTVGKVNAQIMGSSCEAINSEMLDKYGTLDSAVFMGLGDGSLLERIGPRFAKVTVVEASDVLVENARQRFAHLLGLQLINAYFEAFEVMSEEKVSCILGNHILEHVNDPIEVLRKSRDWLLPEGIAIFTVPNATSLHRRIGLELGMLSDVAGPSEQDKIIGHQRVYDMGRLRADIVKSGYTIATMGGFNLKLVSQAQMAGWSDSLHEAIYRVSRECPPELCSNLYVVCRPI